MSIFKIVDKEEQTLKHYKSTIYFIYELLTYYIKYKKDYKIIINTKQWVKYL